MFKLSTRITTEQDGYVALCPELDIASQGEAEESARANLKVAVELFLESASKSELERRCPASAQP